MIKIKPEMSVQALNINTAQSSNHRSYSACKGLANLTKRLVLVFIMGAAFTASLVSAQSPTLADSYPDRYTVVEGDTLWGISSRFLSDPWRWPEIWQGNSQVENPDLIYPGDVLVLSFVDGRPVLRSLRRETVRLSPKPRATKFSDAIPPIDPAAIQAYINSPLVTDADELSDAGYVVEGLGSRLLAGKYDQVYARGVSEESESFRVFRPGRTFKDPVTGELLGYEAVHVGDADMLKRGEDVSRLILTKTYTDAGVRDRLRPVLQKQGLPFYHPKPTSNDDVVGTILVSENEATELGAMSVVAVNFGERDGVAAGDVFRILSQKMNRKDPFDGSTYVIPQEKIGVALVFRTFEKVSYALVTDSSRQVTPGDNLVSPNKD